MVPRPERDTHKLQLALDRDLRDRRQLPVVPRDAEGIRAGFARELPGIVALAEDVYFDSSLARRGCELVHGRSPLPRARVNQEKARQGRASISPMAS